MPGNTVFRWYNRQQADTIYGAWTGGALLERLEAAEREEGGQSPLGTPGVATTESLKLLLRAWQAEGLNGQQISEVPAARPSDRLLRYELICDACTLAEWRAKETFLIRHLGGLRKDSRDASVSPEEAVQLQAEMEEQYANSRAGRFSWGEWPLLVEGLGRLDWGRWEATFRRSYETDKTIRQAGVEQALRENYQALEALHYQLQEGDRQGWALVVYEANDERLPFPPPAQLGEAVHQTEVEVEAARHEAQRQLRRRQRFQRVVVPIILVVVFWFLGFFFTQSFLGALLVTIVICGIIGSVVLLILRRST